MAILVMNMAFHVKIESHLIQIFFEVPQVGRQLSGLVATAMASELSVQKKEFSQ